MVAALIYGFESARVFLVAPDIYFAVKKNVIFLRRRRSDSETYLHLMFRFTIDFMKMFSIGNDNKRFVEIPIK